MSQNFTAIDPAVPGGDNGASQAGKLNQWRATILTMHSGSSRPGYVDAGTLWRDTSATPWVVKLFDGSEDVPLFAIDPSTHAVTRFYGPTPVAKVVTYAAQVTIDASLIREPFANGAVRIVATGDCELQAPTNPVDGQSFTLEFVASGGARTLSVVSGAGGFAFSADIEALEETESGKTDLIGFVYSSSADRWRVAAVNKGF